VRAYCEALSDDFDERRNKFACYGTTGLFHAVSMILRETPQRMFMAHA
jgi:anthraniloyl-CoA monooxygenase